MPARGPKSTKVTIMFVEHFHLIAVTKALKKEVGKVTFIKYLEK